MYRIYFKQTAFGLDFYFHYFVCSDYHIFCINRFQQSNKLNEDVVTRVEQKQGKVRIWTKTICATNTSGREKIQIGDIVSLEGNFEDVILLKNPSYGRYLKSQKYYIYCQ